MLCEIYCYWCPHIFWVYYFSLSQCVLLLYPLKKMWKILIMFYSTKKNFVIHVMAFFIYVIFWQIRRHFRFRPYSEKKQIHFFHSKWWKKCYETMCITTVNVKLSKTITKFWVFLFCHWFLGANWNYFLTLRWWEISQGWELWHG